MKRLVLLMATMLALASCAKGDAVIESTSVAKQKSDHHIYGIALLDDADIHTRGVANTSKVWSRPIAEKDLTVKFLNGDPEYIDLVKEVSEEWMKSANVRFEFVDSDKDALIRVAFDKQMQSSWALTGTDHLQVYGQQDTPTVHFARWNRASDACKRSDVLRAFGQVLGLELEFRHPMFYPAWIRNDETGEIDEEKIRAYWEDELNELISWQELKKVVLDPLNLPSFLIAKTDYYDQESVMSWPFYEEMAYNIQQIKFDTDYNTDLSEQDKSFIQSLYGESQWPYKGNTHYFDILSFDYNPSTVTLQLTATENIAIFWDVDNDETDVTHYYKEADTTSVFTVTASHTYASSKKRKIAIAEILDYGQEEPTESNALLRFDLTTGVGASNFDFKQINKSLECIRIIGGSKFNSQSLNFNSLDGLKELYLVNILGSTVTIDNCPLLETFATSRIFWKPAQISKNISAQSVDASSTFDATPVQPVNTNVWPFVPEQVYSIGRGSGALKILNCPRLTNLILEHTNLRTLDLSKFRNLKYVFFSFVKPNENSIETSQDISEHLLANVSTLQRPNDGNNGMFVIRAITHRNTDNSYTFLINNTIENQLEIEEAAAANNWKVIWNPRTIDSLPIQ